MKKILLIVFIVFFLTSAGFAGDYCRTSGEKTADAAISAGPCILKSITVITDGSNNAKVILYDNASAASGTVLDEITVVANTHNKQHSFSSICVNGIYADVSGTGASYIVEYIPK